MGSAASPSKAVTTARSTVEKSIFLANATTTKATGTATTSVVSSATAAPDIFGRLSAFLGLPGAPATTDPTIAAIPLFTRLTLDDLFGGSVPSGVSDPAAVVTGLFRQVLRTDPTAAELQTYVNLWNLTGINGVVAGLYSSTALRQEEVNNYYLELLGRNATATELGWGATALTWGVPEPLFTATIAATDEFYLHSSTGGGVNGVVASATTFVQLMYRSMVGQAADASDLQAYVPQLQAGLPTGLVAVGFVTSDEFRSAKIQEVYQVVYGRTPTDAELSSALKNWFLDGGVSGISTVELASAANVDRIENGDVTLPDMVAVAQLQQILLAAYTETPEGFVNLVNTLLNVSKDNPCTATSTTCNQALYKLLTTGGAVRGIPNESLQVTAISVPVAQLTPTQNEIDLKKSLEFPLQDPDQLATYFAGGTIVPGGNPSNVIVTADNGTYILDGHHRWSAVYLINPNAQISTVDTGYVPSPQDGLKEAQVGVAAQLGYLATSTGGGINVYTVDRAVFDETIAGFITSNPKPENIPKVIKVFTDYLGLKGQTDAEKMTSIQDYLWSNVLRMRADNPFIPNATSREVMPQTDPLQPTLAQLQSGSLSYTFSTISYLG